MADELYLSAEEVARRFGASKRSIARWRSTGDGPVFVRIGPRRVAYRLSDCEAWAAARTFAHRADEVARSASLPQPAAA